MPLQVLNQSSELLWRDAEYTPELVQLNLFGPASTPITHQWPSYDQLNSFPLRKRIKLNKIGFRMCENSGSMSGIQLGFTNVIKSPLFETSQSKTQ